MKTNFSKSLAMRGRREVRHPHGEEDEGHGGPALQAEHFGHIKMNACTIQLIPKIQGLALRIFIVHLYYLPVSLKLP